ncbi:hypothetical protein GCM10010193_57440 [Kitasatospora atroaurantiaca]|uniref:Uncharacterized protein n=1 Tax=Kitasatospora atroaurantiaca TaxID=285545 RepID=A0A561EN08_9ACTN|nr:hypothetical protein [Kitasatospora atroaurantiaca]TWE16990.1 hypothetical protein FB465_1986 [Kitasatospora atroaurantiaca]
MGARLAAAVHLDHPVTHERITLQPGDEPEPKVAALITHPDAWEPGGALGEQEQGESTGTADEEPAADA